MRLFFIVYLSAVHGSMLRCQLPAQFIDAPADIVRRHDRLQRNLLNLCFPVRCQKELKTVFLKSGEHQQFWHLPCKGRHLMLSDCRRICAAQYSQFFLPVFFCKYMAFHAKSLTQLSDLLLLCCFFTVHQQNRIILHVFVPPFSFIVT